MRYILTTVIALGLCPPALAQQNKVSLVEACNLAVIIDSGVFPKTGPSPDHMASAKFCMLTVGDYVQTHCPFANMDQAHVAHVTEVMWPKIRAVGMSDATDDAHAVRAACP